jgi:cytidine deaminase
LREERDPEQRWRYVDPSWWREGVHDVCARNHPRVLLLFARAVSEYAKAPTSAFKVGCAMYGKPVGDVVYLGVNVEFPGLPLNHSVHAEQCAVATAARCGDRVITMIATTEAPCGHCRQFLNELRGCEEIELVMPKAEVSGEKRKHGAAQIVRFPTLLPASFGPKDLGSGHGEILMLDAPSKLETLKRWKPVSMWCSQRGHDKWSDAEKITEFVRFKTGNDTEYSTVAVAGMVQSYAPYTKSNAGITLVTKTSQIHRGWPLECAAYNPSMSPLQVAIANLVMSGGNPCDIAHIELVEYVDAKVQYDCTVRSALAKIAPDATLRIIKLAGVDL